MLFVAMSLMFIYWRKMSFMLKWFWDFLLFYIFPSDAISSIRYYSDQSLKAAFSMAPADPTVDLNMQLWVAWIYSFFQFTITITFQLAIAFVVHSTALQKSAQQSMSCLILSSTYVSHCYRMVVTAHTLCIFKLNCSFGTPN